ncbi:MAG TPA: hypothetical protein VK540_00330 [Polyangiaceae bacterium]|nr:hypothetical protein [Polyangiaceae bacterium]
MKDKTSRFQSRGGWVALALLVGLAACGSDDDGGGTTPDAAGDTAVDTAPRMDVNADKGSDARSDKSDSTSVIDASAEPANDRVTMDIPTENDANSDGDAGASDTVVVDVPVTPPIAFTIVGVAGPMDNAPDAWLTGTPTPTVQWMTSTDAEAYEITVYEDDGTTVKCAMQQAAGTATSASFPACTLTEGRQYRASVTATKGMFRTAATNDKFRFAVGAVVFGQPDAKTNEGLRLGLALPQDVVIVGTKLIVADQNNNRVLIWNTIPTSNYQQADLVLGQPDFTTSTANYGGIGPATLSGSNGVASDGTHLVVGDRFNNRVLIWNTFPTRNNQPADVVVGQPDFTTGTENTGGVSARSMMQPWVWLATEEVSDGGVSDGGVSDGGMVGGGKLFVSDRGNARVLIWNAIPTQNSAPADLVLGQPDMTTNTANNGGISERSISDPGRGWVVGTRLFLPDYANQRVLIWSTLPTANFAQADLVLGQSVMNANQPNAGATVGTAGLHGPLAVYANGNTIAVADYDNNRVALWTAPITSNGQPANLILGQTTTTGSSTNAGGVSGSSVANPCSVAGDGTRLVVSDRFNNRILLFSTVPTMTGAPASLVVGQPDTVSNRLNNGCPISASSLTAPSGLAMLGARFGMTDGTARVLIWDAPPVSPLDLPKIVLGQPNFASFGQFGGTTTASSLCAPSGLHSDGTRLFVGEQCANRTTIWNTLPTLTQQPANVVVGQPDMMTATGNTGGVLATSLFGRATPYSDGTHLFVSDTRNHRVLIWNTIPTTNGMNADVVLGQPSMSANTQNNGGISAMSLAFPTFVYAALGKLFVADSTNNRVLIWNSVPTADRAPADVVLGQPGMMIGALAATTSAKTLKNPNSIHVDANGRLYVSDPGSHRVLYWNAVPTENQAVADGVIGQPNMDVGVANNGGLSARTLQQPGGMLSSGTLLYVLDSGNDRMLLMPRP